MPTTLVFWESCINLFKFKIIVTGVIAKLRLHGLSRVFEILLLRYSNRRP